MAALDERRANLAAHGRFLSAHLEQGTFLSQPVFALAQCIQAIGVFPITIGIPLGGDDGSRTSWYVEWCLWRRSLRMMVNIQCNFDILESIPSRKRQLAEAAPMRFDIGIWIIISMIRLKGS